MSVDSKIAIVERIFAYVFTNKLICAQALQMASKTTILGINDVVHCVENNERLSVLGDAVADWVMCKAWFNSRDQNSRFAR